ncbi:hypothetical protein GCM10027344_09740 [Spelaeicoccus albus]
MLGSFLLTAIFDVGVTIAVFQIAENNGASTQLAFVLSGIGPIIMMVITWIRARKMSGASLVILLWVLLSAAVAYIGSGDDRLLLVKDSAVTGGFGLACLVSIFFPKPIMFYFGAKFATDGTRAGLDYWYGLWQYPQFRHVQYKLNYVWAVAFILEAITRIVFAYTTSFSTAFTVSNILPIIVLAGLITYTITVGKKSQKAGDARRAAAVEKAA